MAVQSSFSGSVVLFVDDDADLLRGFARAFRNQNFVTLTARSAEEAMEAFKAHPIDLVVSDENMSGMAGSEFVSWVASHFPSVGRIILTGQPCVPTMLRAINGGRVDRFLTKPCSSVDLALVVHELLERNCLNRSPEAAPVGG